MVIDLHEIPDSPRIEIRSDNGKTSLCGVWLDDVSQLNVSGETSAKQRRAFIVIESEQGRLGHGFMLRYEDARKLGQWMIDFANSEQKFGDSNESWTESIRF